MEIFANLVVRFRWLIIGIVVILCLFAVYFVRDIRIDTDMLNYLPEDDSEVACFLETAKLFGANYIAMIALEADDIFTHTHLSTIRSLTNEYEKVPGVRQVLSITNIIDIKEIGGGLDVGKLVDPKRIPNTPEELARLRKYTLGKKMYAGNIVSEDGKAALITVWIQDNENMEEVAARLKEATRRIADSYTPYFGGFPMVMEYTSRMIIKDMTTLTPIVILVVIGTLFLSFRSMRGVFLPLCTVVLSTLFTLAVMAAVDVPVTLISSIMPVVLIATGTAYGIHMINRYYEEVTEEKDKLSAIRGVISGVGVPIILAGVTTLIGFLSLTTATLIFFKQFGLFTALGIFFALLLSISFIPAVLAILPLKFRKKQKSQGGENTYIKRMMDFLGFFVFNRVKSIIILTVLLAVVAVIFIPRISREVNMISYYPEGSEPLVSEALLAKRFGGSLFFFVDLRASDVKNPFVLKEIELLTKRLRLMSHINYPQSITDLVAEMNGVMNNRYCVPPSSQEVENLWVFIEGQDILEQMVNGKRTEMALLGKIDEVSTKVIRRIVKETNRTLFEEVPNDLIIVDLETFSGRGLQDILAYKAKRIETRVTLDLQFYGLTLPEKSSLHRELMDILGHSMDTIPVSRSVLTSALEEYFSSDRADVEIEDQELKRQVIDALVGLTDRSLSSIIVTLEHELPPFVYDEDPDAIEYTAISVETLLKNLILEHRVAGLMRGLEQKLDIDLNDPKWKELYKDLKGDLWGANETQVAIPVADFAEFTGMKPSEEQRVGFTLRLTGMPPMIVRFDSEVIQSQVQSISLALAVVLVLLMLQLRSLIVGLLAMIPILFTILTNFGIMGAFGILLDGGTMMIGCVAIGIGIDYTIHFISRFKKELAVQDGELEALGKTLETTGRAILINTLAVMLGFLVLMLSGMVSIQRFGYLTALTMLLSATGAITIFPAAVLGLKPAVLRFRPKFIKQIINGAISGNKDGGNGWEDNGIWDSVGKYVGDLYRRSAVRRKPTKYDSTKEV
ncbi:MAG: efflux RND transporter permease subunit [Thermodesulfobacteriota bacterium]|nr:efflux RND transporter permease subunit [Thermodesulfobacteriota bacterium]